VNDVDAFCFVIFPNIFSTGPQRNIHGTIFYDVIAVTHCAVVCDTGTINLPNRLLDINI
jgi:hypothetical protein